MSLISRPNETTKPRNFPVTCDVLITITMLTHSVEVKKLFGYLRSNPAEDEGKIQYNNKGKGGVLNHTPFPTEDNKTPVSRWGDKSIRIVETRGTPGELTNSKGGAAGCLQEKHFDHRCVHRSKDMTHRRERKGNK